MAPQMRYAVASQEITNSLVKGMKLLARVGGGEGRGTKVVNKIGAPVSLLLVVFFLFFALGIFSWNFWEQKKVAGNSTAGPLTTGVLTLLNLQCVWTCHLYM